jgi:DNA-directed RNA polymerase specialized sigma24 family protein
LEITPAEERNMRALISDAEGHRRDMERQRAQRREAGMIERAEYEAASEQRRIEIAVLRGQGFGGRAIAAKLGCSEAEVRRLSGRATNAQGLIP